MNGNKQWINHNPAEEHLLELLALEAPQAEWLIRRLARGEIDRDQARAEMLKLYDAPANSAKH